MSNRVVVEGRLASGLERLRELWERVKKLADSELLAYVLPLLEIDLSKEGLRRWLRAFGALCRWAAEKTRIAIDDHLACLLGDMVEADHQYEHLYAVIVAIVAKLGLRLPLAADQCA